MKKKQLQEKDLAELKKMLVDATRELPKLKLELAMRKDKNTKKYWSKRRDVAVLSGMIRTKDMAGEK
jgi:ribosomal protein L29